MPNRVLRDCRDSKAVNKLSRGAECFFYRILMTIDDYGRYPSHIAKLKSDLYPLQLDTVSSRALTYWMAECVHNKLIFTYTVCGQKYLQVLKFGQKLKKMRSRYPAPNPDDVNKFLTGNAVVVPDNCLPLHACKEDKKESRIPNPNALRTGTPNVENSADAGFLNIKSEKASQDPQPVAVINGEPISESFYGLILKRVYGDHKQAQLAFYRAAMAKPEKGVVAWLVAASRGGWLTTTTAAEDADPEGVKAWLARHFGPNRVAEATVKTQTRHGDFERVGSIMPRMAAV